MDKDIEKISSWRSQSIQEIKSYADEQIRILKADYDHQRRIFDEKRVENLELAKVYHSSKQKELCDELYNACRSLDFQVTQLEYVVIQQQRPKVIAIEEQIQRKKQDMTRAQANEFKNNRTRSTDENFHIRESNENDTTTAYAQSILTMSNETHKGPRMFSSANVNDRPPDDNNYSTNGAANGDDLNNKCPICFMIFP
ncbi:unnamed protein product, partial [Rotaria sp. Silwood1]